MDTPLGEDQKLVNIEPLEEKIEPETQVQMEEKSDEVPKRRGRGRPKGSKNKAKKPISEKKRQQLNNARAVQQAMKVIKESKNFEVVDKRLMGEVPELNLHSTVETEALQQVTVQGINELQEKVSNLTSQLNTILDKFPEFNSSVLAMGPGQFEVDQKDDPSMIEQETEADMEDDNTLRVEQKDFKELHNVKMAQSDDVRQPLEVRYDPRDMSQPEVPTLEDHPRHVPHFQQFSTHPAENRSGFRF